MKAIQCSKCDTPMTKGHFLPDIGTVGISWTDKLDFSKWKIESVKKIPTFQYRCPLCGIIETYSELEGSD